MLVLGLLNSLRILITQSWSLIITAILLIPLTACNPSALTSNPDQPSRLVQAILSDPKTFNTVIATDATSSSVGGMIFDGLIDENPNTGEIEPALAESWTISEDKLKFTFTLRKNLKWSDGQPITADDVDFTYNQLYFNPDIPSSSRDGFKIGESKSLPQVRKLNNLQIEFTLPEPFAPFLGITGASILPAHILKPTVEQKDQEGKLKFLSTWALDAPLDKIVANSAYKIKSYATAERVVFEANPFYWKKQVAVSYTHLTLPTICSV